MSSGRALGESGALSTLYHLYHGSTNGIAVASPRRMHSEASHPKSGSQLQDTLR